MCGAEQSIGDVKECRQGHEHDSEAAAGGSAGLRGAKGADKDSAMRRDLLSLTSQIWSKMDLRAKSQFWQFVGLTADGKNVEVCREDSVLKEGNPMVGNCSYGNVVCYLCMNQAIKGLNLT